MTAAYWLNTAWMLSCIREARAFDHSTRRVRATQERILLRCLHANKNTWYGQKHRFGEIATIQQYQQQVPISTYEDFRDPIDRVARGESNVLTDEPVILLEPTGGSTSAEKLVPYTRSLRTEFQRALAVWIHDVMRYLPAARLGRAYWSVSPMAQATRVSEAGIPIGFEDDRDYLTVWQRWAVTRLLATPPQLRLIRSVENSRYATLLYLLACEDLAVISIWSPTYLAALIADAPKYLDAICSDLRDGRVRLPRPGDESEGFRLTVRPSVRRADRLQRIFRNDSDAATAISQCWPRLAIISCWADASSSSYAEQLKELFPKTVLQPKGLLATEGVISFPLLNARGCPLALRSHFFEFLPLDSHDRVGTRAVLTADQLQLHGRYRVVLTTGGGFYRYDIGDDIEVVGFQNDCPLVRFVGRHHAISDLVGEKLHERHVRHSIEAALAELEMSLQFALLAPTRGPPARYRLYVECKQTCGESVWKRLATILETKLRSNPQYRIAINARQLSPLEICLIEGNAWNRFQQASVQNGQRAGDIKPTMLDPSTDWDDVFADCNIQTFPLDAVSEF